MSIEKQKVIEICNNLNTTLEKIGYKEVMQFKNKMFNNPSCGSSTLINKRNKLMKEHGISWDDLKHKLLEL